MDSKAQDLAPNQDNIVINKRGIRGSQSYYNNGILEGELRLSKMVIKRMSLKLPKPKILNESNKAICFSNITKSSRKKAFKSGKTRADIKVTSIH